MVRAKTRTILSIAMAKATQLGIGIGLTYSEGYADFNNATKAKAAWGYRARQQFKEMGTTALAKATAARGYRAEVWTSAMAKAKEVRGYRARVQCRL